MLEYEIDHRSVSLLRLIQGVKPNCQLDNKHENSDWFQRKDLQPAM